MRNDGRTSGGLPDWNNIRVKYAHPLIQFVIRNLPNLKVVIALGADAWDAVAGVAGKQIEFKKARENFEFVEVSGCRCFATCHPSRWKAEKQKQWQELVERLSLTPSR